MENFLYGVPQSFEVILMFTDHVAIISVFESSKRWLK